MSARVELQNMASFIADLRRLPEALAAEASVIVEETAREYARQTKDGYPQGPTGNLKRGVTVDVQKNRVFSAGIVKTRAKHAWLYDHGSKPRKTRTGAPRGSMPERPEADRFVPRAIRARARMIANLKDVLRRAGFEVEG